MPSPDEGSETPSSYICQANGITVAIATTSKPNKNVICRFAQKSSTQPVRSPKTQRAASGLGASIGGSEMWILMLPGTRKWSRRSRKSVGPGVRRSPSRFIKVKAQHCPFLHMSLRVDELRMSEQINQRMHIRTRKCQEVREHINCKEILVCPDFQLHPSQKTIQTCQGNPWSISLGYSE